MTKRIGAYTEIDSIYDSRRGILSLMITEDMAGLNDDLRKQKGDALWEQQFARNYRERRMDSFEYPAFGINREKFLERYNKRSVSDWLFYYPSNLRNKLLKMILELEQLVDVPISISGVDLYINTFPYVFDDDMKAQFLSYCKSAFKGLVAVKLLDHDPTKMTALYYKQYNYVFKYDMMLVEENKAFFDSLSVTPIPETCVVVPDILVQEVEELCGPIKERIHAMGIMIGPAIQLVPVEHSTYDYAQLATFTDSPRIPNEGAVKDSSDPRTLA